MSCARGGTAAPYRASGLVHWPNADKIRIGSPVQWPERQLAANVELPVAISRSATAAGAVTIETLSTG